MNRRRRWLLALLTVLAALALPACGEEEEGAPRDGTTTAQTTARDGRASGEATTRGGAAREGTTARGDAARGDRPVAEDVLPRGTRVGRGATAAWVFRPAGLPAGAKAPTVVLLHGWTATDPAQYGGWVRHLVRRGRQVVFPVYQAPPYLAPQTAFGAAAAGTRAALRRFPADPDRLVAAGHSAGGALAADLAAGARRLGIPTPRAVLAVYPGRTIGAGPPVLPEVGRPPSRVRVVALGSRRDRVVGTRWARRIAGNATRGRYVEVTDPDAGDHLAPMRADAPARRAFWRRLDALLP